MAEGFCHTVPPGYIGWRVDTLTLCYSRLYHKGMQIHSGADHFGKVINCGIISHSNHPVLRKRLSKVNTSCGRPGRSSFVSRELKAGEDSISFYVWLERSYDPHKATLVSMRTHSWFVSYRRLSPQFQCSLSADCSRYLSRWLHH
jgi:hypothetical protein